MVEESHLGFDMTGLKVASIIELDEVANIWKDLIVGETSEIGDKIKREINLKIHEAHEFPV
jgi:hypothetical protein